MADPNPYQSTLPLTDGPVEIQVGGFVHEDLEALRKDAKNVGQRGSRYGAMVVPFLVFLFALYQFGMCWKISSATETPIADILFHDIRGFPADSYSGAFVRVFDRLVTGFFVLMMSVFLLLMGRSDRKHAKLHSRLLDGLHDTGVVQGENGVPTEQHRG